VNYILEYKCVLAILWEAVGGKCCVDAHQSRVRALCTRYTRAPNRWNHSLSVQATSWYSLSTQKSNLLPPRRSPLVTTVQPAGL